MGKYVDYKSEINFSLENILCLALCHYYLEVCVTEYDWENNLPN